MQAYCELIMVKASLFAKLDYSHLTIHLFIFTLQQSVKIGTSEFCRQSLLAIQI